MPKGKVSSCRKDAILPQSTEGSNKANCHQGQSHRYNDKRRPAWFWNTAGWGWGRPSPFEFITDKLWTTVRLSGWKLTWISIKHLICGFAPPCLDLSPLLDGEKPEVFPRAAQEHPTQWAAHELSKGKYSARQTFLCFSISQIFKPCPHRALYEMTPFIGQVLSAPKIKTHCRQKRGTGQTWSPEPTLWPLTSLASTWSSPRYKQRCDEKDLRFRLQNLKIQEVP